MSGKIIPNFDMNKLPEYVDSLLDKKVMIIGVGAVGSYVAEILTKVCVVKLILVDMDDFETANIAKSSLAYIVDEDNLKYIWRVTITLQPKDQQSLE